jgi:type I restriction enzyme R subunit
VLRWATGEQNARVIAAEPVTSVRSGVTIDWTLRKSTRAGTKVKVKVKRILKKLGFPPGLRNAAVQAVLLQAEKLCKDWAA